MRKNWRFFKESVCNFRQVGSIVGSSAYLVDSLLKHINFDEAKVIVEFGPGTGCVTRELLRRMRSDARLYSFELSPVFFAEINSIKDERLTAIHGSATRAQEMLPLHSVDCVVSGLPMGNFGRGTKQEILQTIHAVLKPNGFYSQFQYSLIDYILMRRNFKAVRLGFVPANFPPAFVYNCFTDKNT